MMFTQSCEFVLYKIIMFRPKQLNLKHHLFIDRFWSVMFLIARKSDT